MTELMKKYKKIVKQISKNYSKEGLLRPYAIKLIENHITSYDSNITIMSARNGHIAGKVGFVDFILDKDYCCFANVLTEKETEFSAIEYNENSKSYDSKLFDIMD